MIEHVKSTLGFLLLWAAAFAAVQAGGLFSGIPCRAEGETPGQALETMPFLLPLNGPLLRKQAEISGLCAYGDTILLLPQYPDWEPDSIHRIYSLPKQDIADRILGAGKTLAPPLSPDSILVKDDDLYRLIPGFEGFEAMAVVPGEDGLPDRAYLCVESRHKGTMHSHLIQGTFSPDHACLTLDKNTLTPVPLDTSVRNISVEALVWTGEMLLALPEASGANLNPSPKAYAFSLDLVPLGALDFPRLEYRLTDATDTDASGEFWVLNTFWSGDEKNLSPAFDALLANNGQGSTHSNSGNVERLVAFTLSQGAATLSNKPPILLTLSFVPRNWEGLAFFEHGPIRGFLLATDMYPGTLLGFIPLP